MPRGTVGRGPRGPTELVVRDGDGEHLTLQRGPRQRLCQQGHAHPTSTEASTFIPAAVAEGLAVGQKVTLSIDTGLSGRPRNGLLRAVWSGKKLVAWYGVKL